MKKLLLFSVLLLAFACSKKDEQKDVDSCPCEFTLSQVTGNENNSYYLETLASLPNPCDSYLDQNIDLVTQLYENDGTYQNPIKGINRAGSPRTGTILFTSNYLNALESGIGSIISHGGSQNDETVVEYNCK